MIRYFLKSQQSQYTLQELEALLEMVESNRDSIYDWCGTVRSKDCRSCKYTHLCYDLNKSISYLHKQVDSGEYK